MNRNRVANRKRVLVTGGAGFLGSHLCERLLSDGAEVLCVDSFYSGARDNIRHLLDHPHFEGLRHDVSEPLMVEVDEIYNLACPASPVHHQRDPIYTMKTSEIYGDLEVHPQVESYWGHVNPVGIRCCYDEGKRAAETLFFDYHRMHGVRIRCSAANMKWTLDA